MQSIASGISRKIIFISEAVCGPLVDHSLYRIMFAHRKYLVKSIRGIYKQADTLTKQTEACGVNGEAQVQVNRLAITGGHTLCQADKFSGSIFEPGFLL